MLKLFTNATANDATKANAVTITGQVTATALGVHVAGTFDTCTVGVYISNFGATNGVLLTELTFTAAGYANLSAPPGTTIWAELSSVGASTDISCWVSGQGND